MVLHPVMSDPVYETISRARRQEEGGNPEGAADTLRAFLSKEPDAHPVRLELARILVYSLDDRNAGIEQLDIILDSDPDNIDALKASTTVRMVDKKFREGVNQDYLHLISLIPDTDRREYAKVCAAYAVFLRKQMVQFETAAEYYEKAIAADSEAYEYHQDYAALLLHDLKDYIRAKEELEEVLRLKPNSMSARKNYDLLMKTKFDENGNLKKKGFLSRFRH